MTTNASVLTPEAPARGGTATMKALVYLGDGKKAFQDKPKPVISAATDAIVRIVKTTICGTDLHILKGDLPAAKPGLTLGHEGVGIIDEAGSAVRGFKKGDRVLDLLRYVVRCVRVLPKAHVLALPGWRLDLGQHDRRHAGGLRPHSPCGQQPVSHSDGRRRGAARDVQRHLADRVRVRRPQRSHRAGEHGCHCRIRTDRTCGAADRPVLRAGRNHYGRPRSETPRHRLGLRRDESRQQQRRKGEGSRPRS